MTTSRINIQHPDLQRQLIAQRVNSIDKLAGWKILHKYRFSEFMQNLEFIQIQINIELNLCQPKTICKKCLQLMVNLWLKSTSRPRPKSASPSWILTPDSGGLPNLRRRVLDSSFRELDFRCFQQIESQVLLRIQIVIITDYQQSLIYVHVQYRLDWIKLLYDDRP
jgi:RNase P subunit RPR2